MRKTHFLLCYDIADSRRLQRIQRLVIKQMLQIQYSMYYAVLTRQQMDNLLETIRQILNVHHDDLRVYVVKPIEQAFLVGKRCDAVMLFGMQGERIAW